MLKIWLRTWGPLVGCVVLIAALAWVWTRQHRALGDALRDAEAAKLALKQQIVETESTRRELQASVAELLAKNSELRTTYDQAVQAAPGARPVSASRLDTGPLTVEAPVAGGAGVPNPQALAPPAKGSTTTAPPALCSCSCALTYDQHLSVSVDQIELQTKEGNALVVGTAAVWRESPKALLATGRFRSALSDSRQLEQPAPPRWGAEVVGLCTGGGCGLGAGVLLPPFRVPLLGLQGEARAALLFSPALGASAGLGVRW